MACLLHTFLIAAFGHPCCAHPPCFSITSSFVSNTLDHGGDTSFVPCCIKPPAPSKQNQALHVCLTGRRTLLSDLFMCDNEMNSFLFFSLVLFCLNTGLDNERHSIVFTTTLSLPLSLHLITSTNHMPDSPPSLYTSIQMCPSLLLPPLTSPPLEHLLKPSALSAHLYLPEGQLHQP